MNNSLIEKYNVAGPRYTSYPTVPHWKQEPMPTDDYIIRVQRAFAETNEKRGISLYIHLPFCTHLCHYCGCNVRHTNRYDAAMPYLMRVLKEWKMYLNLFGDRPRIQEVHIGGGTPTFYSAEDLGFLMQLILSDAELMPGAELSFEAHPENTTRAHLKVLHKLGFRRISFGIQDFDLVVQEKINRIQSPELVAEVVAMTREVGFESINFDLIYGLPLQTEASIRQTLTIVNQLRPDRIAYYSYAHVPWKKGIQRKFDESDLPSGAAKLALYELGKRLFAESGYTDIGMDHFALPTDSLFKASEEGTLHRNFMGYTTNQTQLMIGLGASSISDSWDAFAQNHKSIRSYEKAIDNGELPIVRGHLLSPFDMLIRKHILALMCQFETSWKAGNQYMELCLSKLTEMEADKLIERYEHGLRITEKGKPFVRNVCMGFDPHLVANTHKSRIFSSTV